MKVIEFRSRESKEIFYVEVDDQAVAPINPPQLPGGGKQAGLPPSPQAMMGELEKVGEVIANVCGAIQDKVAHALKDSIPQELTLEFGVKLAGEAGVPLVTKGTVEGTFKVIAKWISAAKADDADTTKN